MNWSTVSVRSSAPKVSRLIDPVISIRQRQPAINPRWPEKVGMTAQNERNMTMNSKPRVQVVLAVLLVLVAAQYSAAQGKKPNLVILATGGTIAGAAA